MRSRPRYRLTQDGYTLVEVVVASAIGAILMTALTSVILTSVRGANIASSRIEASAQIRNFEFFAADDFARSGPPPTAGCGTPPWTCPIVLTGTQVSNSAAPSPTSNYVVTYTWDQTNQWLDRQVGANPPFYTRHAATNVSASSQVPRPFSWYLDLTAPHPTVVISLTVTVQSYSESQTWRFYPRVNP